MQEETAEQRRESSASFGSVSYTHLMIAANTAEIESMYKVSAKLFKSKLIIVGDISDHLACNR